MALYYTLPVYKDVYRLIQLIFRLSKNFPREYKYSLGQDIKRDSMQLIRHIYRANTAEEKAKHLAAFADDFELIKLQIRLCHDMRIISTKHYAETVELMNLIGKQITGWYKKYQT
ncbi:MAG: four helix bundle protein [Bacteroides sp.]|nr:four helix bundle protein [Bacteroides sp.]